MYFIHRHLPPDLTANIQAHKSRHSRSIFLSGMIQTDRPEDRNPFGPKCQRLFTHPHQPAVLFFLTELWTWLLTYPWWAITAYSLGRFIDRHRLLEPHHDPILEKEDKNKKTDKMTNIVHQLQWRTRVTHETFYLQFGPRCQNLASLLMCQWWAALPPHFEEEEGNSNPSLQVKELMQIHPSL